MRLTTLGLVASLTIEQHSVSRQVHLALGIAIPSGAAASRSQNLEGTADEDRASRTGHEESAHPV
jgi:hypothetical protein